MRFLCLPGAYGSAENFKVQLAPFCKELETDGTASFFFTQGTVECTPPPGFTDYFGPSPHYRFFRYDGIGKNDILERIRDFPEGEVAEDVLRKLMPQEGDAVDEVASINESLDALYETIAKHGPFDGICAYSEGTVLAGTFILDEARRLKEEGRPRSIKRAVFFAGWPPLTPVNFRLVLADESEDVIDIPTCHVVGADDPYIKGALCLYGVCEPDDAILFDHGKGHTIPRDNKTVHELGDAIRGMVAC
ncbi:hypothetical protein PVAG01_02105 [Phlyctema vagabunda]|uniref:Serine hydrolase domain-containing protein n=1 Tax=Phlyctema vagabunda TaxID=108571 RepID=A0ABR4PPR7_9HELO